MSEPKQYWLCSYDVTEPKRLKKIHQLCHQHGIALNYSVFYLHFTANQAIAFQQQLKKIVHLHDDVRVYRCQPRSKLCQIGEFLPQHIQLLVD